MILFIVLAALAFADDPTKITVSAQLVDEDGNKIELIYRNSYGDLLCREISNWKVLNQRSLRGYISGPSNQTWCVANVHIMAGSSSVTKGPYFDYRKKGFFDVEHLTEDRIRTIKDSADGNVTFRAYPGVGTIVLRTDPIGGHMYYGEIDSSKLPNPGVMPEVVQVVMSRLPVVQVVSPFKSRGQHSRLVDFGKDNVVFPQVLKGRQSSSTGDPMHRIAGMWVVMPGQYTVNGGIIPDGSVAMISRNGDVVPFNASEPLALAMNDSVVISIGPAVE